MLIRPLPPCVRKKEFLIISPVEQQEAHVFAATLGAVYTFNANWSLKASISNSLRDDTKPGPRPAGVFYVVWNF